MRNDIRVDLAPIKVDGLVVELHQDFFSPQLAVSNRTGKLLEILDADGRAFVRIGPDKAEGDLAAKAYHLSRIAGGGDAHANTLSATPRWRTISREPAYGWFDTRIATALLDIPYAVKQIGSEMPFGQWRIPARLGGEPLELRGVFTYTPPPAGIAMAVMQSPGALAPGVIVQMVPGPTPAFFLRNSGSKTVAASVRASLLNNKQHTLLLSNVAAQLKATFLTDQSQPAPTGQIALRFLDEAISPGSLDLYLVPSGSTLAKVNPLKTSLAFGDNTGYLNVPTGTYTLYIVTNGTVIATTTVPLYTGGATSYAGGSAHTVVILDQQVVTNPAIQVVVADDYESPNAPA